MTTRKTTTPRSKVSLAKTPARKSAQKSQTTRKKSQTTGKRKAAAPARAAALATRPTVRVVRRADGRYAAPQSTRQQRGPGAADYLVVGLVVFLIVVVGGPAMFSDYQKARQNPPTQTQTVTQTSGGQP